MNILLPGRVLVVPDIDSQRWDAVCQLACQGETLGVGRSIPPGQTPPGFRQANEVATILADGFRSGDFAYASDPAYSDVWQSPARTLAMGIGDCEDWAIFIFALLQRTSASAQFCIGTVNGVGHAWVEVVDEAGWALIECTSGMVFRRGRPQSYRLELIVELRGYKRVTPRLVRRAM